VLLLSLVSVMALIASACSSGASSPHSNRAARRLSARSVPTTSAPTTTTTAAPPATTTTTAAPPAPTTTVPAPPTTAPAPAYVSLPVPAAEVGSSGQVMTVVAPAYGDTVATFTAYQRTSGGWQVAWGPWQADVGESGVAPPGEKQEGDGRTPSGSYGFSFFFEDLQNPGGFTFPVRQATSSDYLDDDPSSPSYNQWVDESTQGVAAAGANPEPMYDTPAYDYGAVIDYNTDPVVPGAGSAIFLHVS